MSTEVQTEIRLRSCAKLNLTLEILGLLPGGYHAIETLFQSIDLEDSLTFRFSKADTKDELAVSIAVTSSIGEGFPLNDDNLIAKAAKAFAADTGLGIGHKLQVTIEKRIPMAAGLAGGSGNAAATLIAMNQYFGNKIALAKLEEIAATLGSDIGFCLSGGTAVGRQRGEVLEAVPHQSKLSFIIVKPRDIAISTPWVYRAYDEYEASQSSRHQSKLNQCIRALKENDLRALCQNLGNAFEDVVFQTYPHLKTLRERVIELGCLEAHITGSGPTLYGVVENDAIGQHILKALQKDSAELARIIPFDTWFASSTTCAIKTDDSKN